MASGGNLVVEKMKEKILSCLMEAQPFKLLQRVLLPVMVLKSKKQAF